MHSGSIRRAFTWHNRLSLHIFHMMRRFLPLAFFVCTALLARGGELSGSWRLEREQSDSMRSALLAQGYTHLEALVLDRAVVTQRIRQTRGNVVIDAACVLLRSNEWIPLDGVWREADSLLGRVRRAARWDGAKRMLVATTHYVARNGEPAELHVRRHLLPDGRMAQETRVRLSVSGEFVVRQVFRRAG